MDESGTLFNFELSITQRYCILAFITMFLFCILVQRETSPKVRSKTSFQKALAGDL